MVCTWENLFARQCHPRVKTSPIHRHPRKKFPENFKSVNFTLFCRRGSDPLSKAAMGVKILQPFAKHNNLKETLHEAIV